MFIRVPLAFRMSSTVVFQFVFAIIPLKLLESEQKYIHLNTVGQGERGGRVSDSYERYNPR